MPESGKFLLKTIYLVRHAVTDWNEQGRLQGQSDVPLNERGLIQAAALAEWFQKQKLAVDAVVSSDLRRAVETAAAIARAFDLEVQCDPRFRERGLGTAEGKTWEEVLASEDFSGSVPRPRQAITIDDLPGVEPREAVIDRFHRGLMDVATRTAHQSIVIISHGSALASWLQWRFKMPERPRLKNAEVVTIVDFPERERLLLP